MSNQLSFIKASTNVLVKDPTLTTEYVINRFNAGNLVQVNIDLNIIIAMENLGESATVEDVKGAGLYPLYKLLNNSPVYMAALGINECPDARVKNAKKSYERFCHKFWPNYQNAPDATDREFNKIDPARARLFEDLPDDARSAYGLTYVAMLHMQNVLKNYRALLPEQQFDIYVYGMLSMVDRLHAFELEIAKYVFWKLRSSERERLPESIRARYKAIHHNFVKSNKCFNATMDIALIMHSAMANDAEQTISEKKKVVTEHWVATMDSKLAIVCRDMRSVQLEGHTSKYFFAVREKELDNFPYWRHVTELSKNILRQRQRDGIKQLSASEHLRRIDLSVESLTKQFIFL